MKNAIAIAASLLVNLSLFAVFEHSANESAPNGEVVVTDLNIEAVSSLAQTVAPAVDAG